CGSIEKMSPFSTRIKTLDAFDDFGISKDVGLHPEFLLDRRGLFTPYGFVKAAFQFSERKNRLLGNFAGQRKGELDHVSLWRDSNRRSALTQLAAKVILRCEQHFPAQSAPELVRNDPGCVRRCELTG